MEGVVSDDIVVDGRRWRYFSSGEPGSPYLLFVHGFRSSARFFRPTMLSLSDRWQVVAPDLPGHGDSDPWDPEEDVVEQWVLLEGFLEAMGMDRMCTIGASRGGAVALQLAAHRPHLVDRLVLMAAPTKPFQVGTLDIKEMVVDKEALSDDLLREMGRTMMASRGYETARARSVSADALERDLRPIMGQVEAPTLVIWGSEDRTIPVEMGLELLAGIPDSRMRIVGGAGHVPFLDKPRETVALIREFLGAEMGSDGDSGP
ncbi:MAG: alpha/beta hydrolase [Thermoplasmata archaeon]|nr:MAG: alpha/beta hydrolase [Thermoplasmata archaeon]